jgi:2,3-bisphosphoglycerate-independent phosphoglycerate mutase
MIGEYFTLWLKIIIFNKDFTDMAKALIFLADGMADEPLAELGGKTPLEAANTPNMDAIAAAGTCGTFLTLPQGLPTSSDVANMSVMGFGPQDFYPGRGPIEAVSQGIELAPDDVAWRCNLVTVIDDVLTDYSAGHIDNVVSSQIMSDLQAEFGSEKVSFYPGVSYRNLMVLHGNEFSNTVDYFKPDSSQGGTLDKLRLAPIDDSKEAAYTVAFIEDLSRKVTVFLALHPLNQGKESLASHIWPWSPGRKPSIPAFTELYGGKTGAVISAVDVIQGIGMCTGMEVIKVPGATGFIDTNYAGKVAAAIDAIKRHDFVYLHVEAIDECSHMGDLKLKMQAIEDFDAKIIKPVLEALKGQDIRFALLPDHPVPITLRAHTRTPVPLAVCGFGIVPDAVNIYNESSVKSGRLGLLKKSQLMHLLLD